MLPSLIFLPIDRIIKLVNSFCNLAGLEIMEKIIQYLFFGYFHFPLTNIYSMEPELLWSAIGFGDTRIGLVCLRGFLDFDLEGMVRKEETEFLENF